LEWLFSVRKIQSLTATSDIASIKGYLSDKLGRKFGMVRKEHSHLHSSGLSYQMSATGIVALFSCLSAASQGTHQSLSGMLAMLSAMRYVPKKDPPSPTQSSRDSFLLGIGIGAEYPCGSVSASEQSEQPGINKRAQHRWVALATSERESHFLALRH